MRLKIRCRLGLIVQKSAHFPVAEHSHQRSKGGATLLHLKSESLEIYLRTMRNSVVVVDDPSVSSRGLTERT